jgi:flagellar biosynthesis chaperone FliJ
MDHLQQQIAAIEMQIQQIQSQIEQLKFAVDIVQILDNAHIADDKQKVLLQKQVTLPIIISSF